MNYLLHASLSCCLAMSSTVVVAGGNTKNPLVTSGEHSAISQDLPSIHLAVGGPWEKAHQQVLIDGFWPFFQQEQQLLFLQGGWLRQQQQQQQQQRNLLSAGLGWRYFPETDWGVGSNLFYDQDLTRQHRRIGLGAEAWWQSLTLTANGYLPASSWRTARDLKEIRERPAQGYDVTLKGYLPAVPHLGASVRYARYFGDEVAVGSSQQRHRNPKQWRWGVDVTPIPLLTLAYHHQPGLSSHDKHQISAALTYRFSLPLSQQLDPRQVTLLHSAEGQRLARVQRDQLMVLQYAKIAAPIEKPLPPAVAPITKAEPEGDSEVDSEVALIEQRAAASAGPETGLDAGLEITDFTEQRLPLALTPETGSEVGSDAGSDAGTEASPSSTERLSKDPLIVAPSPVVPKTVRLVGPLLPVETTRLIAEQQLASQYQPPIQSPTVDQTQVLALLPKPDLRRQLLQALRLAAEPKLAGPSSPVDQIPVLEPNLEQQHLTKQLHNRRPQKNRSNRRPKQARHKHKHR